jgi:hypothetical protein
MSMQMYSPAYQAPNYGWNAGAQGFGSQAGYSSVLSQQNGFGYDSPVLQGGNLGGYFQSPYTAQSNYNDARFYVDQGNNNQQGLYINNQGGTIDGGVWQDQNISNWNSIYNSANLSNSYDYSPVASFGQSYAAPQWNADCFPQQQAWDNYCIPQQPVWDDYCPPQQPQMPCYPTPNISYFNYSPVNFYFNYSETINQQGPNWLQPEPICIPPQPEPVCPEPPPVIICRPQHKPRPTKPVKMPKHKDDPKPKWEPIRFDDGRSKFRGY